MNGLTDRCARCGGEHGDVDECIVCGALFCGTCQTVHCCEDYDPEVDMNAEDTEDDER